MRREQKSIRIRCAGLPERGGFTLPELVAVIIITAIIAATAAPSLSNFGHARSAIAARQALHDITFARQKAMATGIRCWVVFDADSPLNGWSVLAENPDLPGRASATVVNDFATGRPFVQNIGEGSYHGVSIIAVDFDDASEIGFDWLGRPLNESESDLAGQGTVTFTGGHILTIEVGTGHVRYISP